MSLRRLQHRKSAWAVRPNGSTWGDYGPDDQLGRLNLITPERRRAALAEAREGVAFCLSLPLDLPGGNALAVSRHPPQLSPTSRPNRARPEAEPHMEIYNHRYDSERPGCTDVVSDDRVDLHLQYSTQWDSFAHFGQLFDADGDGVEELRYYNGFQAGLEIVHHKEEGAGSSSFAYRLGIDSFAESCVQGRGVLVDLGARYGRERVFVGYEELMALLAADDVVVDAGDILCLSTGFDDLLLSMNGAPDAEKLRSSCAVLDGHDHRLLDWITASGIAAIVSDTNAVEGVRPDVDESAGTSLPLHEHCLFRLGVPLGEFWRLSELAAWLRSRRRSRFLLTAPPLRLPGAVGSPVTPVATV
ncbi:MAG: cyclase family protein [Caulobacteraceae bacterium]|nr:cyclase family protein [Caulobacteraceae bacterium]